ncbi:hypothetical protein O6H91_06G119800 [Diphasiastrum complanatum]|uniref:Uncharacterized protein n=1 Tax=Diphasiastrum complanatum TaxID=34168 RepID=A0ACC2DI37_DIPCM|nr:hypothetical protein O6H91_06G119800 [Diphasiastrum complanatum]
MAHSRGCCFTFSFSWILNSLIVRKKVCFSGFFFLVLLIFYLTVVFKLEFESIGSWTFVSREQISPPTPNGQESEAVDFKEDLNAILIDRNILKNNYQFVIKVLAYDRLHSLARCLYSLALADYGGDTVVLHIFVDHFKLEDSPPIKTGAEELKNNSKSGTRMSSGDDKPIIKKTKDSDQNTDPSHGKIRSMKESTPFSNLADKMNPMNLVSNFKETKQLSSALDKPQTEDLFSRSTHHRGDMVDRVLGNQSDPLQEKLNNFHDLLQFIDQFYWPHGPKEVFVRSQNVGLQSQWIEVWWPTSEDEFAFIVEDDMELSPLFYRFLRGLIANYYYNPANFDPTVYGISLQRPRFVAGKGGKKIQIDNSTRLFLYQMVGTWGQLLFPTPWKEFRLWYDNCKSNKLEPLLEGMITTSWYKRLGQKIWTPWFIKFIHSRGYYNIYTNFLQERALSVSHRDEGVNYKRGAGPDSIIIRRNSTPDVDIWEMLPYRFLKKYDFCFHEVPPVRFVTGLDDSEIQALLSSLVVNNKLILVNFGGIAKALSKNWLCHVAKLGMKNYLVLGDDPIFSGDLARRGHAVMQLSASQLLAKFRLSIEDHEVLDYILNDLTLTYVAQHALQMSYDVWLTTAGTLWLRDPPSQVVDMNADVHGREVNGEEYDSRLLYIRSTNRTSLLWDCVVEEILAAANSLLSDDQKQDLGKDMLGKALWKCTRGLDILVKTIDQDYYANIQNISSKQNVAFLDMSTSMDRVEDSNLLDLIEKLKSADLWMLDHEFVCKGVFCQSKPSL